MAAPILNAEDLELPDEVLVDRLRMGDHGAFDEIYDRYYKRIYHFVNRRLGNRADVEETVQEIFFNVFSSVGSWRGEAPFAAWIFGVTRRTIASRFKKKRHPTVPIQDEDADRIPQEAGSNMSVAPSPIEHLEYNERVDNLHRLMDHRLSEEQRTLFELHHLREIPIQEIAERLGKSEDAVKSNLYRTRKILLAR